MAYSNSLASANSRLALHGPYDGNSIHSLADIAAAVAPVASPSYSTKTQTPHALADGEKPTKRGANLACLRCRAIKVRCSKAQATDKKCKRCIRLDLECEYKEHHRGRKPKKRARTDESKDQLDDQSIADSPSPQKMSNEAGRRHRRDSTTRNLASDGEDAIEVEELEERVPSPNQALQGQYIGPYLQSILNPANSIPPRSSYPSRNHINDKLPAGRASTSSSRTALGFPQRSILPSWAYNAQGSSSSSAAPERKKPSCDIKLVSSIADDAVKMSVITLYEAEELFRFYFDELNPPLALLDPHLHNVKYCRRNCPLLFSMIISTASRFFRPEIHAKCLQVQKSVMALAAVEELCSVDHIQALILAVTWKDSSDRTIDRKVVRAVGYGYELGLHASFDSMRAEAAFRGDSPEPQHDNQARLGESKPANRSHGDTEISKLLRRLERDRQRTWVVLCLVQAVMRKDDGPRRPRPRVIPVEDHPDVVTWYRQGEDITLTIDARLCWSLESVLLSIELSDLIDLCAKTPNPASMGSLFQTFYRRAQIVQQRWFRVEDGEHNPRFPMDKSAVAELPYLESHRMFCLHQATWHWAYKVTSQNSKRTGSFSSTFSDWVQPLIWFNKTADAALRVLQLFVDNLVKPGYLRVGHDYLVICASQAAKWLFAYRSAIDPILLTTAHELLQEIIRECSQPQRLPNGEPTSVEREAPGYLVRFVEALLNAGLSKAVDKAKQRRVSFTPSDRPGKGYGASDTPRLASHRSNGLAGPDDKMSDLPHRPQLYPSLTYRSDRNASSHYRDSRFGPASQRTELDRGRGYPSGQSSFAALSYERGYSQQAGMQNQVPYPVTKDSPTSTAFSSAVSSLNAAGAPHPAYPSSIAPHHGMYGDREGAPGHALMGFGALTSAPTDLATGLPMGVNIAPINGDVSKASLDSFVSNLGAQDLNYWENMLGTDLSTFG